MNKQLEIIKQLRAMGASLVEMSNSKITQVEFFENPAHAIGFGAENPTQVEQMVNQAMEGLKDDLQESKERTDRKRATHKEQLTYGHAE